MALDRSFIEQNRFARARLAALVARLSDEQLSQELADGWTVATALAHVAFWDRRAQILLERWRAPDANPGASPYDVDVMNDAVHYLAQLIPPRLAANEAVEAAIAIDQAIESLDDATLARILATGVPRLHRAGHRDEHANEIERIVGG